MSHYPIYGVSEDRSGARKPHRKGGPAKYPFCIRREELDTSSGSPYLNAGGIGCVFIKATIVESGFYDKVKAWERCREMNLKDYGIDSPTRKQIERATEILARKAKPKK